MSGGVQGYSGPDTYPQTQQALDYVNRLGNATESGVSAPCLEEVLATMSKGAPVDQLIQQTAGTKYDSGESVWRGGEDSGCHGLVIRGCARAACGLACQVTVAADGRFLDGDAVAASRVDRTFTTTCTLAEAALATETPSQDSRLSWKSFLGRLVFGSKQ